MSSVFLSSLILRMQKLSNMTRQESRYSIPISFRKMENMHIVFWLIKDISWCLIWKPLGITMIFPTLIIAIIITIRTRQLMSELCHNLAIVFWISANAYWMISEFLHFDEHTVSGSITYKDIAVIPFSLGIIVLGYYYIFWRPRNKGLYETM